MVLLISFAILSYFLKSYSLKSQVEGLLCLTDNDIESLRCHQSFKEPTDGPWLKVYRHGLFSLINKGWEPITKIQLIQSELRRYERRMVVQENFMRMIRSKVIIAFLIAAFIRFSLGEGWLSHSIYDLLFLAFSCLWGVVTIILSWAIQLGDWCTSSCFADWMGFMFEEKTSRSPWLKAMEEFRRREMQTGVSGESDKLTLWESIATGFHQKAERQNLSYQDMLGLWELIGSWPIIILGNSLPIINCVDRLTL